MTKDTCAHMAILRCEHPLDSHEMAIIGASILQSEQVKLEVEQKRTLDNRRSRKDMPPQLSTKGSNFCLPSTAARNYLVHLHYQKFHLLRAEALRNEPTQHHNEQDNESQTNFTSIWLKTK
jgi:hypothetical protein